MFAPSKACTRLPAGMEDEEARAMLVAKPRCSAGSSLWRGRGSRQRILTMHAYAWSMISSR
eukprot:6210738-Pleurochrysis_carterae.AAC.4